MRKSHLFISFDDTSTFYLLRLLLCSIDCQIASWRSHKLACKLAPPSSLAGIKFVVTADDDEAYVDDEEGDDDDENPFSALKTLNVKIEHTSTETTVKVGNVEIQVIDLRKIPPYQFFDYFDEFSHDLANLALLFDTNGRLRPNEGCWRAADFRSESHLVYVKELVIEVSWRGRGLGTWLLPRLFYLEELKDARFLFSWPTVLNQLESPLANGRFGEPTLDEQLAWVAKRDRIIKFYRKVGFRRLANSDFFCLAKKSSHLSHAIPMDEDAPLKPLPPPRNEEEETQRYLARQ
ncbi:hypothetical protein C8J57DRAFT_1554813 [Mycena rebaudengoi]|nr:hypothetical protein C8J57DRAFT_1554813 [Mycena rebaudengoi]